MAAHIAYRRVNNATTWDLDTSQHVSCMYYLVWVAEKRRVCLEAGKDSTMAFIASLKPKSRHLAAEQQRMRLKFIKNSTSERAW
jgi:hypothetical protein